ncbi:MAG: YraN family protein [Oscillospiraceae bacterium]|nr:YraN family protein [Oscillospiraceae bacterium]
MTTRSSGDWGEAMVAEYLRRRGFRIVVSQYRCRFGEIDLVARDGKTLCFVEVKLRSNLRYGLPREFVTAGKRDKLRTTAGYYLATHDPDAVCRFDVAEVYTDKDHTPEHTRIEYIENAF